MRRRDLLGGAAALTASVTAANAFGLGKLGANYGGMGQVLGSGAGPPFVVPGSALYWRPLSNGHAWSEALRSATDSGPAGTLAAPTNVQVAAFSSNDNSNCAINAAAVCSDIYFKVGTGWRGILSGTSTLAVKGSWYGSSKTTFSYTGTVTFNATATGKTITSAGKTFANATFNGAGGGWALLDAMTIAVAGTIIIQGGTLNTNGKALTAGKISSTTGTRGITLDNSAVTVTAGSGTIINIVTTVGTLTWSAAGSTLTFNGGIANTGSTQTFGALTYGAVVFTGTGQWNIGGGPTFTSLSYTNLATVSGTIDRQLLHLAGDLTVTGACTITGQDAGIGRIEIKSNVQGLQRTLSCGSVTASYLNLQDINGQGAASWNLSAITGNSGDGQGNSNITFTTPAAQTFVGGVKNWSDPTAWTSRVPLAQDNVTVANNAGGTLTIDMYWVGNNVDFTGFTQPIVWGHSQNIIFGNLTFSSGMSQSGGGGGSLSLGGRSTQTITFAGQTVPHSGGLLLAAPNGTYTQQDDANITGIFTVSYGKWVDGGHNLNAASFGVSLQAGTTVPLEIAGSGIWSLSGTTGTPWSANAVLITTSFAAQIKFTGTVSTTVTFAGAGKAYGGFEWVGLLSTGTLIFTGANSFGAFKIDAASAARSVTFPAGATTTVTSFAADGQSGALLTLQSSSPGSPATVSDASGINTLTYTTIKDMAFTGGATWIATNSIDGGGNSGITITP